MLVLMLLMVTTLPLLLLSLLVSIDYALVLDHIVHLPCHLTMAISSLVETTVVGPIRPIPLT
jgi:hypothetical protein